MKEGGISNIICRHQNLLEPPIRLSYLHAIILVQFAKRVNLLVQMRRQRVREILDELAKLPPIILCRRTSRRILLEPLKPRRENTMLLDVALHQAGDSRDALDAGEELCFFGVVVVVHGFAPALAVSQEVADGGLVRVGDVGGLQVDGVEATEDAVVGEGHLGRDVVGGMGCLCMEGELHVLLR